MSILTLLRDKMPKGVYTHLTHGDKNSCWRGGRIICNNGYIKISKSDHPFCDCDGYVLEHRLVMEKKLGRYLRPDEIVHHRDGNVQNNTEDNLELMSQSDHMKLEITRIKRDPVNGRFVSKRL